MREDFGFLEYFLFMVFGTVIPVCIFIIAIEVSDIRESIETNNDCIVHNNEKYCKEVN